jgi:hypothetical protein
VPQQVLEVISLFGECFEGYESYYGYEFTFSSYTCTVIFLKPSSSHQCQADVQKLCFSITALIQNLGRSHDLASFSLGVNFSTNTDISQGYLKDK